MWKRGGAETDHLTSLFLSFSDSISVRAGASDLPTTAAYLGGVVAQEAIKLLTEQYIPLNNTAVIDLIRFVSTTFLFLSPNFLPPLPSSRLAISFFDTLTFLRLHLLDFLEEVLGHTSSEWKFARDDLLG